MDKFMVFSILVVLCKHKTNSLNLPGPLVYVVTPSPPSPQEQGRSAPFYYHNWMRRMDSPSNATTTTAPKLKTPDLIFAEFESGNKMKSIRKLLEKEKVEPRTSSTTTTRRPINMADESSATSHDVNFAVPVQANKKKEKKPVDMTDYFALYNNQYNTNSEDFVPVYMPSTTPSTTTSTTTTTTTTAPLQDVKNIWHIIDTQKYDQYSGKWEEESVPGDNTDDTRSEEKEVNKSEDQDHGLDDNFALPGFATNPVNGGENESRSINKEMNMRFPYVNLKPFQMKTQKKPTYNGKQGDNMLSLDNFHDLKNPVRGEAQDVVPVRKPIDRYNPAQPYLPDYATKSKQSSKPDPPTKAISNLIPPPPPPPKISDDDFPAPDGYESFPPYAPVNPSANLPPPPPPAPTPSIVYQLPEDVDDSGPPEAPSDDDNPPIELEYHSHSHYKPPPPPPQPTYTHPPLPPPPPPSTYTGYSYNKPIVADPLPDIDQKDDYAPPPPPPPKYLPPDTYGHYKPYGYHYTTTSTTEMPRVNRYSYYYLGKKLYYLPLYFSVYFIVYVGALIIKAVLRHKIVYPNSWRPNDQTASFFSKRSVDSVDLCNEQLHEITGRVTHAIAVAGEKYFAQKKKK